MFMIIGGSGVLGVHVTQRLLTAGVPGRVLLRRAPVAPADAPEPPKNLAQIKRDWTVATGDIMDPGSLAGAFDGVETVFLATPCDPTMVAGHANVYAAAKAAGVKRIVRISIDGADPDADWTFARWHGEAEQALEASGLGFTHVRPTFYMTNLYWYLPGIQANGALTAPMGRGQVAMVDPRDVAKAVHACLTEDWHAGKTYTLGGPEALDFEQVAGRIGAVRGAPVRYRDMPADALRAGLAGAGWPGWAVDGMAGWYARLAAGAAAAPPDDLRALNVRKPTSLAGFLADHAAGWQGAPQPA